jgi:cytochrome bd-type quinol oxidase subunit 2
MSTHAVIKDALIAAAILNLAVTAAITISSAYNGRQKILQILIVWLFPVLGSVLIGLFMLTQREDTPPSRYPSESGEDVSQIWAALHPPGKKD